MVVAAERRPNVPLRLVTTGFVKFSSLAETLLTDRGRPAVVKEIRIQVVSQEWERNMACLYSAFRRAGVETLQVGTFFNQIVFSTRPKFTGKDSEGMFKSYLVHVHNFFSNLYNIAGKTAPGFSQKPWLAKLNKSKASSSSSSPSSRPPRSSSSTSEYSRHADDSSKLFKTSSPIHK